MTGNDEMEELEELLAAYVIDALDEDERDEVERYLDANPGERDEVQRLTTAFDELVATQSQGALPPPDLWDRIAGRLAEEGKSPRVAATGTSGPTATAPAMTAAEPDAARGAQSARVGTDELAVRRRRPTARTATTAVALVAAAILLVVVGLALRPKDADTTMTAARVEQDAGRAAAAPGSSSGTVRSKEGDVDLRVVLDGRGRMYVVPERLPALDDEHAYQLWALDSGTPVSLGMVHGAAAMDVPAGQHPTQLALSREPATGSPQPTSTPVAVGQLA